MRKAVRAIVFRDNDMLVMKRNKFGQQYCTLPGGGVQIGESAEQTLHREMHEESGLQLGGARLVFIDDEGEMYGTQYIYLVDYVGGEPKLNPGSGEAEISAMGQNLYEPMWLPTKDLATTEFISERLKQAILKALQSGFPEQAITI